MKSIQFFIALLLSIPLMSSQSFAQDEFPVLKGLYLGQKPPGLIPEVFAPGIVSIEGRFEGAISFSPELNEVYFEADSKEKETHIYFSKLEGDKWAPIKMANFTKGKKDEEIHPFVSPYGERIYFTALNSDLTDTRIWYVNRLANSWSDAIKLDSPINEGQGFAPNQAANGDFYYFDLAKGKTLYASENNGNFKDIRDVDIEFGIHAFISPAQDYLLVNARNKEDASRNDNDIYVYFKEKDGTWTLPIHFGNSINTEVNEVSPSVTPDGKYLFFSRSEEDGQKNIYWVSTEAIEKLRPKR